MWRYQVFARKLTWYFIGVYVINVFISIILAPEVDAFSKYLEWDSLYILHFIVTALTSVICCLFFIDFQWKKFWHPFSAHKNNLVCCRINTCIIKVWEIYLCGTYTCAHVVSSRLPPLLPSAGHDEWLFGLVGWLVKVANNLSVFLCMSWIKNAIINYGRF